MNYQETLDYLYGLTKSGIKLGLNNTARLLDHFDNPQKKVPAIHIAGTNGKGSTAAFTESILRHCNVRVGMYTSPHLLEFTERIRLNGVSISRDSLARLATRIRQAVDRLSVPVTFFEFGTVLAFLYFYENGADWNVVETGLGGRLDATALCQAKVSVITSISLDHTEHLGTDLCQIAFEKASIIQEDGTVFADNNPEVVLKAIQNMARDRNATLNLLGKDFSAKQKKHHQSGQLIDFYGFGLALEDLELPLLGHHQAANAALAIAACLDLKHHGIGINETGLRQGLRSTVWEGRLEVLETRPTLILDCAHNPSGAKVLTDSVRELFPDSKCILVLGIMRDKPVESTLEIFSSLADRIILSKPKQFRSEDPENLMHHLQNLGKPGIIIEDIGDALQTAREIANSDDVICVTGSIFTIAEAKQWLSRENGHQANPHLFSGNHLHR